MSARSINVMGDGTVGAGQYEKIKIFGTADFMDGVDAQSIAVFGDADLGEVTAREIKVSGNAEFRGSVNAGTIKINGSVSFSERVKSTNMVVNGEIRGDMMVETEKFVSRGSFTIGELNANDVEIFLAGRSRVKEIGAETIRINPRGWFSIFQDIFGPRFQELEVDTIEADRIYLERTIAQSVRGKDVTIGAGCRIKLVEYTDSVVIDPRAQVEKSVKI